MCQSTRIMLHESHREPFHSCGIWYRRQEIWEKYCINCPQQFFSRLGEASTTSPPSRCVAKVRDLVVEQAIERGCKKVNMFEHRLAGVLYSWQHIDSLGLSAPSLERVQHNPMQNTTGQNAPLVRSPIEHSESASLLPHGTTQALAGVPLSAQLRKRVQRVYDVLHVQRAQRGDRQLVRVAPVKQMEAVRH